MQRSDDKARGVDVIPLFFGPSFSDGISRVLYRPSLDPLSIPTPHFFLSRLGLGLTVCLGPPLRAFVRRLTACWTHCREVTPSKPSFRPPPSHSSRSPDGSPSNLFYSVPLLPVEVLSYVPGPWYDTFTLLELGPMGDYPCSVLLPRPLLSQSFDPRPLDVCRLRKVKTGRSTNPGSSSSHKGCVLNRHPDSTARASLSPTPSRPGRGG